MAVNSCRGDSGRVSGGGYWPLVGGYSLYLYGAISQSEGAVLTHRGKEKRFGGVVKTGSKRWRNWCVCVA